MISEISDKTKEKARIEILKNIAIFSEANDEILSKLAFLLIDVNVEKNEEVFHKGDEQNAMYIIVAGSVTIHDGSYVFTQFKENDFFGEYSLIDSSIRSATATANEKTQLLRLNQEDFQYVVENNADVTKSILKALIKRLRNNNLLEETLTKNNAKIESQKEELEELNATKDKFFTLIAHDLRNPFNTVIGLSELLINRYNSYDDKKIIEFIKQINKYSNNAYSLLENLLQWAKSQTGRMKVNLEKIDLFNLITENKSLYKEKTDRKDIKVIAETMPGEFAYIDENMIKAVIRNLISNAIKFTKSGGKVFIRTKKIADYYEVMVSDTGIGISRENLNKLFKIESNISTLGTDNEVGTGLGLIISKEFIEKNNGTIDVYSEEGVGSSFKFTVPIFKE